MIPTTVIMLLLFAAMFISIGRFHYMYMNGWPGDRNAWAVAAVAALLLFIYTFLNAWDVLTSGVSQLFLTFALLLIATAVMVARVPMPRKRKAAAGSSSLRPRKEKGAKANRPQGGGPQGGGPQGPQGAGRQRNGGQGNGGQGKAGPGNPQKQAG